MTNRCEKAKYLFENGCNCAQAVLLAFSDLTGLDDKTALRLSSSFGGGMGRLREVCGALTGAFMAAGLIYGPENTDDINEKFLQYDRIKDIGMNFKCKYGTYLCRDLLELDILKDIPLPQGQPESFYQKQKCLLYVEYAAKLLDDYIKEQGTDK
ncbi:MAG: C-GCAxxG-C-C family protein [Eubacteriales bacterium]|jgi:C_GCAxxG_C_C family probable redox protein